MSSLHELPPSPRRGADEARRYVRSLVRLVGIGFHPDQPFSGYVDAGSGRASFGPRECRQLEAGLNRAWRTLDAAGEDLYAIAHEEQRRILQSA